MALIKHLFLNTFSVDTRLELNIYTLFYKQHFYKQRHTEIGKKLSNTLWKICLNKSGFFNEIIRFIAFKWKW